MQNIIEVSKKNILMIRKQIENSKKTKNTESLINIKVLVRNELSSLRTFLKQVRADKKENISFKEHNINKCLSELKSVIGDIEFIQKEFKNS